jgi:hypothetical protein
MDRGTGERRGHVTDAETLGTARRLGRLVRSQPMSTAG